MPVRRNYGDGSVYQRSSDGRWIGAFVADWGGSAKQKRRITVSALTKKEALRKLRARQREYEKFGDTKFDPRMTVKAWAEKYLQMRAEGVGCKPLRPNALKAATSAVNAWVIPTIGHRHLRELTPGDIRKVIQAQFDAGKNAGGVAATHRPLMTMLRFAKAEGAMIPDNVFMVSAPAGESDREPLSLVDTLRCLAVAADLPHGLRWAWALLYGARQGELLGLTEFDPLTGEPLIDWDAGMVTLRWQLQQLPYKDPKDKTAGFKIPRGYKAVHLTLRWHLVEVKSPKGHRILPLVDVTERALREWLEVRPANPWGLVFPAADGRPADHNDDREEWWAIQYTASVQAANAQEYAAPLDLPPVWHPASDDSPLGRYYHVHECRNSAATELERVGASDTVSMSLLGHTRIETTKRYRMAELDAKREVIEALVKRYELE